MKIIQKLLLSILMILTLGGNASFVFADGTVAKIGENEYVTLEEAFTTAKDGETITLVSDMTLTKAISDISGLTLTLDMNGHTIDYTNPDYPANAMWELFYVCDGANFTITGNGTINGPTGETGAKYDSLALMTVKDDSSTLTILDGTYNVGGVGDAGLHGIYIMNGGNLVLGDSNNTGPSITAHFNAIGENNTTSPANVTIYGGTYKSTATPSDSNWWKKFCSAIYVSSDGTLKISGGDFSGYYAIAYPYTNVEQETNITGGTYSGSSSALFIGTDKGSGDTTDLKVDISEGSFSDNSANAYVSGSSAVATVTSEEKTSYAVGTTTINNAVKNATSDTTITVLSGSVTVTETNEKVNVANSKENTSGNVVVDGKTVDAGKETIALPEYTYVLQYDANGGEGAPKEESFTTTDTTHSFAVSSEKPTRNGYNFVGWATTADATTANVGSTVEVTNAKTSVTLYAVWEAIPKYSYTISYDANGGNGAPGSETVNTTTKSNSFTVSTTKPTREGYTFKGWSKTKDDASSIVTGTIELESTEPSLTLYAIWEKEEVEPSATPEATSTPTPSSKADGKNSPNTMDSSDASLYTYFFIGSCVGLIALLTLKSRYVKD